MVTNVAAQLRLMLVADERLLAFPDPLRLLAELTTERATTVQLRFKALSDREILAFARRAVATIGVPIIINDRPDLAFLAGAAGVHLGERDVAPRFARELMGQGRLVGSSVGTPDEVPRGMLADYWGVGPWRMTETKADAGVAIGAAGFGSVVALAGQRPCLAIGGVRPSDVPAVLAAGGVGVAVSSGVFGAADPVTAVDEYVSALRNPRTHRSGPTA